MSAIVNTFLSIAGEPILGGSPTIRIWEITDVSQALVVTDDSMIEVIDGSPATGDGFYKYVFAGYDELKEYVVRVDAGASIPYHSRYYVAEIATCDVQLDSGDIQNIVDGVWDEPAINHIDAGSTGEKLSQIHAASQTLILALDDVQGLVELLLKYETNRTKIDATAKTLTVYDDDCTTVLRVFDLLDSAGDPSVEEVCERKPTSATDGLPVCTP